MNQDLKRLVHLQDLMQAVETVGEKIAAVPVDVARLEKDLLAAQQEVETMRGTLSELQKERRRLEAELMGIEAKIGKYQGQLLDVKTNKEYQAMLHEIEGCRRERAALDEKILLEMEEAEKRNALLRSLDERLKEKRRRTDEGKKRLGETLRELEAERERLLTDHKRLKEGIPPHFLDPFMKVARQRKGLALVAVREELCGGCHVRVMPKLIQQVRRAEGLIACDSCKRFLYVPDEPGAIAQGGSGQASAADPAIR